MTTDKVSGICLSWKTARLISWWSSWIPIMRPYDDNFHIVKWFLGISKESLFSFQSAIGSEIQSNVKHTVVILKIKMAALWRKLWHCQNVHRYRKHWYTPRHLNFGPKCNRTGDMGNTMVILAPCSKSIWRPPGVANFWDTSFFYCFIIIVTKASGTSLGHLYFTYECLGVGSHADDEYSRSGRTRVV